MLRKCLITLALTLMLVGAAGTVMASRPAAPLTEKQQKRIAAALGDRQPGKPVNCVSRILGTRGLEAASDGILLYRVNSKLTYRNDLSGQCTGISSGNALVLQPTVDQYCRGDIAYAIDLTSGMRGASCSLGDFVPYRAAER